MCVRYTILGNLQFWHRKYNLKTYTTKLRSIRHCWNCPQQPIFITIFLLLGHCEGRNRKLKDFIPAAKVFQQQPKIVHPIKKRQSAAEHINEKVNEKKMGEVITHLMGSSFTDKMVCPSFFAGPKCLQPPNPCSLPRPPMNWIVV